MNLKLLKKKILKLRNDCVQACRLTHSTEKISYGDNDESLEQYLKAIREVKEFDNDLFIISKIEELCKKYTFEILLSEEEPK